MRPLLPALLLGLFAASASADVVINEIMYHPQSEVSAQEYVELFNTGAVAESVGGWQFTSGISFTIPAGTTIAAGGYLVVAANGPAFTAKYPDVTNFVAGWTGQLSNASNTITLVDNLGVARDEVDYSDDGDWGQRIRQPQVDFGHRGWIWRSDADGFGKSLELINPAFGNHEAQNWAVSGPVDGTPGVANSVAAADIAPVIDRAAHFPLVPRSVDNVTITCRVRDDHAGPLTVKLFHRLDGAPAFAEALMKDDGTQGDGVAGDGVHAATLQAQAAGSIVEFYFTATDGQDLTRVWPAPARDYTGALVQSQNCLYQVDDTPVSTSMPLYRMVLRAADRTELSNINTKTGTPPFAYDPPTASDQSQSHARFNATFISIDGSGSKLRYLAGARNRGNGSRGAQPQSFNVQFSNADTWNGLFALALNTQFTPWQVFGSALYRKAGLAGPESRAVQVRINGQNPAGAGAPSYGFYACNEVQGSQFAEHHFPGDSNGSIYRSQRSFEGTTPGGTVIRNGGDLSHHTPAAGETLSQVDLYKLNYRKETNGSEDQWGDLIALTQALAKGQSGVTITDPITYAPDYLSSVESVADIAQFARWFAVQTFADNEETNLSNGDGDDYYLYIGQSDPRAKLVAYDLDTILGQGGANLATHGIFRMVDDNSNPVRPTPMNAFIKHPAIAPLYYGELKRLLDGAFSPAQFDPFCDSILAGVAPANVLTTIKNFNAARHTYITGQVPLKLSATSTLPIVSGLPRSSSATAALTGKSDAVNTRSVKVNGMTADWTAWSASWSAAAVSLKPGVNQVLVQAFNGSGAEIDRMTYEVWYEDGSTVSVSGTLAANTTWTAAGGPYQVTANLTVPAGVTLTIEPGTSVLFAAGTTLTVTGTGRILAEGTPTQLIRFGSVPGAAAWGRILIQNTTAESRISYAHLAGNGSSAIRLNNGIAVLDHLTFGNPAVKYLDLDASSFVVSNCVFPSPTAALEPVHGSGGIMPGGRGIIRDCFFGKTLGYNDTVDFTGGNRPGPILQVLNCVFIGSDDDLLDIDGTDAWVEGNIFMHAHRNGSPDSSSAVSGGNDSGQTSEMTIVGNLFLDVDQAITAKQGNFYTMLNNTVVDQNGRNSEDLVTAVVNLADDGTTEGLGVYLEGNVIHSAAALMRNYNPALSTVTLVNNITPTAWPGPGAGNLVGGALLNDPYGIPTPNEVNWRQLLPVIREKFALQPRSPGKGTGPNGTDLGGARPLGVSIGGIPSGTTAQTSANATIGTLLTGNGIPATAAAFPAGSGWTHYRWRLDGGGWSAETAIANPISLAGLASGAHTLEVAGRNDAGFYQDHTDYGESARVSSVSWTVNTAYVPPPGSEAIRINEVLAMNSATVNFGTSFPDIIELHNPTAAPVSVAGWGLTDNSALPFKYTFPAGSTIAAGGYLVVYASGSSSVPQPKTGFGLKREGDTLTLTRSAAAGGGIADSVPFGYQLADRSIGRARDGSWSLCVPTFGSANVLADVAPRQAVKINEWLAEAVTLASTDFIEIYNSAPQPVDVGLCHFSVQPVEWPDQFQIRQLTFIPANGYLVFKADDDEGEGPDHVNFKLSPLQGELALFDPSLLLLDNIVYGPQSSDVSEGRSPSGGNAIARFGVPTPGGPNQASIGTTTTVTPLIAANHGWKYYASGSGAPPNDTNGNPFQAAAFIDSAWTPTGSTAAQLFYIEAAALSNTEGFAKTTVLPGITASRPYQTYYFRTHFNYTGTMTNLTLNAKVMVDDGAVIYLNGTEVARLGVNAGAANYSTLANRMPADAVVEYITIPATALVQGDNVLAVSVHQGNTQSSGSPSNDVAWGMKLDATVTMTGVALNEVLASNASLQNPDGSYAGWIELWNPASAPVDLSDMSLSNSITQTRKYVFPAGTILPPGGSLVVQCNGSQPVSATNTGFSLSATGGIVGLYHTLANGGALNDSVSYGRQVNDLSIGRSVDGTGAWTLCNPTRNAANAVATLGNLASVKVNEWLAAPTSGADFLELFNTASAPVALGGVCLSDDLTDREKNRIPALSFIGATGASRWQRWIADADKSGTPEHVNFELDAAGESVGVFSPDGFAMDSIRFYTQQPGRSSGRFGDGNSMLLSLIPTPGVANQLAADSDADADGILDAWEMAQGFNPNNALDAGMDADGDGGSNRFEYLTGTDPLANGDALRAEIMTSGGSVAIRFIAVAGKTYTVQYKNDLSAAVWSSLANVPAGGSTMEVQVPDPTAASVLNRYYRVITPAVP